MRTPDARSDRSRAVAEAIAACHDAGGVGDVMAAAILDGSGGRHAHCVFHDGEADELWRSDRTGRTWRASQGLVGAAVAARHTVRFEAPHRAAAYVAELDAADARRADELLLVPIATIDGPVEAVIVVARAHDDPPWDAATLATCDAIAAGVARALAHWVARQRDGDETVIAPTVATPAPSGGPPLRLTSRALSVAWMAAVALLVVALAAAPFVRVNRYSVGVAVVREPTRTEVLSLTAGTVAGVHVHVGQEVEAGDPLVSLDDALVRADLVRLERAWADEMRRHLLAGTSAAAVSALAGMREQIDQARERLRRTVVRATRSGRVGEIRVVDDQPVQVGERVAALVDETPSPQLIALMPGTNIDDFEPRQVLRYSPAGHPRHHFDVVVTAVDPVVVGPAEARRWLGERMADGVPLDGPVAILVATLDPAGFVIDDEIHPWQDGMIGRAQLEVGSDSVLDLLLPLKELR